jgi:hypothetical protein
MLRSIMLKYITLPITCIFLFLLTLGICTSLPKPFSIFPLSILMPSIVWFALALPAVCALLYIYIYLSLPKRTFSFYEKYKISNACLKRDVKEILH